MSKEYLKNPHPGEILKEEFIVPLGISQNELAQMIFVPSNRIHDIIRGKRRITANTDLRLCKLFGLSKGFFLRLQGRYDALEEERKWCSDIDKIIPLNI